MYTNNSRYDIHDKQFNATPGNSDYHTVQFNNMHPSLLDFYNFQKNITNYYPNKVCILIPKRSLYSFKNEVFNFLFTSKHKTCKNATPDP